MSDLIDALVSEFEFEPWKKSCALRNVAKLLGVNHGDWMKNECTEADIRKAVAEAMKRSTS